MAELSQQTGVVKASLYHYFPEGKKGMAEAALDTFGTAMSEKVVAPLLGCDGAQERLLAMIDGMDEVYDGGDDLCLFALLSIGDTRALFASKIIPKVAELASALTQTLIETGLTQPEAVGQSEQMIVEVEGALIVSRVLGDPGVFQRTLDRLRERVLSRTLPSPSQV